MASAVQTVPGEVAVVCETSRGNFSICWSILVKASVLPVAGTSVGFGGAVFLTMANLTVKYFSG